MNTNPRRFIRHGLLAVGLIGATASVWAADEKVKESSGNESASVADVEQQEIAAIRAEVVTREAAARKGGLSDADAAVLVLKHQELARLKREYMAKRTNSAADDVALKELQAKLATLKTPEERRQALEEHVAMSRVLKLKAAQDK